MGNLYEAMAEEIENDNPRSAWDNGVREYALELIEDLEEYSSYEGRYPSPKEIGKWLLNGASDWGEYSWGGCSLIYDREIAERLCNASELKLTHNGERRPNKTEEWLDVQARALYQASDMVIRLYNVYWREFEVEEEMVYV